MNINMNMNMKLGDIKDMKRYLEEDCYCPGEIYSPDGFFFRIYDIKDKCKLIGSANTCYYNQNGYTEFLIENKDKKSPQILFVFFEGPNNKSKIYNIERIDATKNNIKFIKDIIDTGKGQRKIDEFKESQTEASLNKMLSLCDIIIE